MLEKTCNLLDEKFVKLVQVAEQKQDMNKITEANALKRKCEEKDEDKKKFEEALKILAEKKEEFVIKSYIEFLVLSYFYSFLVC